MGGDAIPVIKKRRLSFCSAIYISSKLVLTLGAQKNFFYFFDVVKYNGLYLLEVFLEG